MTLQTSELKRFKATSSFIRQNNILPILGYLLIKPGSITKSNLESFCVQKISYKGDPFLIEEAVLMSAIEDAGDQIEVKITDKVITLSSNGMKWKSQPENLDHYPLIKEAEGEPIEVSKELADQIQRASNFTEESAGHWAATCVFVDGKKVSGSNNFIAYMHKIESKTGQIFLPKTTCAAIRIFESFTFQESASHHFFSLDGTTIGISKPEHKYVDISMFFEFDESARFTINKSEFIQFNTQAIKTSASKLYTTAMTIKDGNILLSMIDSDYNRGAEKEVKVSGSIDGYFKYNPEYFNRILKSMPGESLTIHQTEKGILYISSDEKTISLIMKIN